MDFLVNEPANTEVTASSRHSCRLYACCLVIVRGCVHSRIILLLFECIKCLKKFLHNVRTLTSDPVYRRRSSLLV